MGWVGYHGIFKFQGGRNIGQVRTLEDRFDMGIFHLAGTSSVINMIYLNFPSSRVIFFHISTEGAKWTKAWLSHSYRDLIHGCVHEFPNRWQKMAWEFGSKLIYRSYLSLFIPVSLKWSRIQWNLSTVKPVFKGHLNISENLSVPTWQVSLYCRFLDMRKIWYRSVKTSPDHSVFSHDCVRWRL